MMYLVDIDHDQFILHTPLHSFEIWSSISVIAIEDVHSWNQQWPVDIAPSTLLQHMILSQCNRDWGLHNRYRPWPVHITQLSTLLRNTISNQCNYNCWCTWLILTISSSHHTLCHLPLYLRGIPYFEIWSSTGVIAFEDVPCRYWPWPVHIILSTLPWNMILNCCNHDMSMYLIDIDHDKFISYSSVLPQNIIVSVIMIEDELGWYWPWQIHIISYTSTPYLKI